MNRIFCLTIIVAIAFPIAPRLTVPAEYPFITGPLSSSIGVSDVDQLIRIGEERGLVPWIIEVQSITPDADSILIARAYMVPDKRAPRIRRGLQLTFSGRSTQGSESSRVWTAASSADHYAQVSLDAKGFGDNLSAPLLLEMPFRVNGQFSDDELISLMEFMRSSAHRAGGPMQIGEERDPSPFIASGLERIFNVDKSASGVIWVSTEDTLLSGLVYFVESHDESWSVSGIHRWVSYPDKKSKQR